MRLTTVGITGYRSIRKLTAPVAPLTVLVGNNGNVAARIASVLGIRRLDRRSTSSRPSPRLPCESRDPTRSLRQPPVALQGPSSTLRAPSPPWGDGRSAGHLGSMAFSPGGEEPVPAKAGMGEARMRRPLPSPPPLISPQHPPPSPCPATPIRSREENLCTVVRSGRTIPPLRRHRATRDERAMVQDRVVWGSPHIRRMQ